MLATVFN